MERADVGPRVPRDLRGLLTEQRDLIVARFVAHARRDLAPPDVSRWGLMDHIPAFLDEIVLELTRLDRVDGQQDARDTSANARTHGRQRWSLGYDLDSVIREYGVLRHCIVEAARAASIQFTLDVLSKCLTVGVAEAASEYVAHRDRELAAQHEKIEFLAQAGELLASSLDYRATLGRLTSLLVPRLADWCAIHLDGVPDAEMPIAHADPTKVQLLREMFTRFPPPESSIQGHSHVVRTGQPVLVARIDPASYPHIAQTAEHLEQIRALGTRSFMIVPLRVQSATFGALLLGYAESEREYDAESLMLMTDVARRAAVAIEHPRLYALSQSARSRAETATRVKDELLATVSHELRTPLNVIQGWVRLLRSGTLTEANAAQGLEAIERNADAQTRVVADLLDIGNALTGKIELKPSTLDLGDVVNRAADELRLAAAAKRIQIDVRLPRGGGAMSGDAGRLQQLAWNLLSNAVKFTPNGGHVLVRVEHSSDELVLTVADDGIGIKSDFLPYVFESFRQADSSSTRQYGGLGVGLSLAKHIVELHGGRIEARSAGVGQGATFEVHLPLSPVAAAPVTLAPPAMTSLDAEVPTLRGVRVLIVDDDPDARELLRYVLETSGMRVQMASSADEALAQLEDYVPDVVMSDIGMPGVDGYGLIRRIRTLDDPALRDVPVIALTAFTRSGDRKKALVEGFNAHLGKPAEPDDLVRVIAELLGRSIA
jgi:signal transduction histidine kinase/CheY-like chemotaxis protein